jgi:tetratricopeptide (TPR) repeat protein
MSKKLQYWILFGGSAIIYLGALSFDYVLDDDLMIKNQFVQKGFDGISDILTNSYLKGFNGTDGQTYRPIPLISFAIEKSIFGLNSSISHAINLLLYLGLGYILFQLIAKVWAKTHPLLPFIVTALFLFHPVHTEVVANVKSRDELLCALGGLLALLGVYNWSETHKQKHYFLFLAGAVLAVFSKETGLAYLIAIPFFIGIFQGWKTMFQTKLWLPLALLIIVFFGIRLRLLETMTELEELAPLNNALLLLENPLDQKATAIFYTWIYVWKWIWPAGLSWDYSTQALPLIEATSKESLLSILGWVVVFYFGIRAFVKKQTWVFGLLLFFLTLLPTSNILLLFGATFGERFLFSPSIGLAILSGLGILFAFQKIQSKQTKAFQIGVLALLGLLTFKSFIQKDVWESQKTIAQSGIISQSKSTRTWEAYGSYCRDQTELARNKEDFNRWLKKSIEAYQKSVELYDGNYSALYNLGVLQMNNELVAEAKMNFQKCVDINPAYEDALNNLGYIALNQGDLEKAKMNIFKLLELNPNHISGLINLGLYEYRMGNIDNSAKAFEKVLSIDPQNEIAKKNLGVLRRSE